MLFKLVGPRFVHLLRTPLDFGLELLLLRSDPSIERVVVTIFSPASLQTVVAALDELIVKIRLPNRPTTTTMKIQIASFLGLLAAAAVTTTQAQVRC